MSSKKHRLRVDWVSPQLAAWACKRWHYSKTAPPGANACLGAWENDAFVGVAVFGTGVSRQIARPHGLLRSEVLELVRVAMKAHDVPVTRFLAVALRMLKKQYPQIRLVVSFADPNQGHEGKIYQAGNWIYTGQGADEKPLFRTPWGNILHNRATVGSDLPRTPNGERVVSCGNGRSCTFGELTKLEQLPKYRYVYPLDSSLRATIESKPFKVIKWQPSESTAEAVELVRPHLTQDLLKPKYRGKPDPMAGHCYVASEVLRHLLGNRWLPMFIKHEDESHWFLRHSETGEVLDMTESQFKTPVPHGLGRRQAFLTKKPSKRAQIVIDRIKRAGSIDSDAPGSNQPGEGGAGPTSAL
jgi:hypothetical protein